MDVLGEYKLSGRSGTRYYRYTQRAGFVPLVFIGVLIVAVPSAIPPQMWSILGLTAGLHLILAGCYHLYHTEGKRTRWGTSLASRSDQWYPLIAFLIQNGFFILMALCIWVTLLELGFPATWYTHLLFGLLAITIPLRRLTDYVATDLESPRLHLVDDLIRCVNGILVTLLLTSTVIWFLDPSFTNNWKLPLPPVIIWVIAVVAIIGNIILMVDRIARAKQRR